MSFYLDDIQVIERQAMVMENAVGDVRVAGIDVWERSQDFDVPYLAALDENYSYDYNNHPLDTAFPLYPPQGATFAWIQIFVESWTNQVSGELYLWLGSGVFDTAIWSSKKTSPSTVYLTPANSELPMCFEILLPCVYGEPILYEGSEHWNMFGGSNNVGNVRIVVRFF